MDYLCNTEDGDCRFMAELAELRRFREREPLVWQLVNAVMDEPLQLDADEPACAIVRFGDPATPAASEAAGDESA